MADCTVSPPKKWKEDLQTECSTLQYGSSTDRFYDNLEENILKFKYSPEELTDIQRSVLQIVRKILDSCFEYDNRYKCSEILCVGSYSEGSKIVEPTEFDFLAVMEGLSKPDVHEVKRVCSMKRGFAHIFIKDEKQKELWKHYLTEGQLASFLYDAVSDLSVKAKNMTGIANPIDSYFKNSQSYGGVKISSGEGVLEWVGFRHFHGPNTVIYLLWTDKEGKSIRVDADISVAIRCTDIHQILSKDDCLDEKYFEKLEISGSYLLVPGKEYTKETECRNRCFRLSFTETEAELIRCLHPVHLKSFRILKYIIVYCNKLLDPKYPGLSSYIIKTAVLHHSTWCGQPASISVCVSNIVDILFNSLMMDKPYLPNLPSIFVKQHNLFEDLLKYQNHRTSSEYILMHIHTLIGIHIFQNEMDKIKSADYSFDRGMRLLNVYHEQMKNTLQKIFARSSELTKEDGSWDMPISSKDLMKEFAVPFVKICEK